jgi:kynurenine formamidase
MPGKWIDVSVPLRSGMVHCPDTPPVEIERMLGIELAGVLAGQCDLICLPPRAVDGDGTLPSPFCGSLKQVKAKSKE